MSLNQYYYLTLGRVDASLRILLPFSLNNSHYVSILEPGSIVERQGWEICWAKPIGAKNLDRQQHIREAVINKQSASKLEKTEKSRLKQTWDKKHPKCGQMEIASMDDSAYLVQMKILQDFVAKRFDATCIFDCVQTPDASGYIGIVNVLNFKNCATSYPFIYVRWLIPLSSPCFR